MSRKLVTPAGVDAVFQGQGHGSIAKKLLANGMQANALRTNDTLQKDEWKELDNRVVDIAKQRLVGVGDLVSQGLVHNLSNGLGTTVFEYEDVSDFEDADVNMDGVSRPNNDRHEFDLNFLPLPIVHKGFQISARVLAASRRNGTPLDTRSAATAARKVAEKIESILFTGLGTYNFGGGSIYGYTNFPNRNTGSLTAHWDDSGADPLADVIAMKQASITDRHYGPWMVYIPTNFETALDDDFKANSDKTMRQRLRDVEGIIDVKVADFLTTDEVVMVEMTPDTARIVIGMQPTTVEWDTEGGMLTHYKVMSIMVPQLIADQDDRCGIIHFT